MKLISMTDFVIQEWEKDLYTDDFARIVKNYADFLKQPLRLGMFVPCDENDVPLEEPKTCCSGRDCGCMGLLLTKTTM